MAYNMTIGDLAGFVQIAKAGVAGLNITDFDALFDKIESLLKATGQWNADLESNLKLARGELKANPGLFQVGKAEFVSSVDALLAKYPASTLLKDIPEFAGSGTTGPGTTTGTGTGANPGALDIAEIQKIFSDVKVKYDAVTKKVVVEGAGYEYQQVGIERLQFKDGILAFDSDGSAGQAYRLYSATGRAPDADGLGYWVRQLDAGKGDLLWMARNFLQSAEFKAKYGDASTMTNESFLNTLYTKLFGRTADSSGTSYWLDALSKGAAREHVLLTFTESAENKQIQGSHTDSGIWFV